MKFNLCKYFQFFGKYNFHNIKFAYIIVKVQYTEMVYNIILWRPFTIYSRVTLYNIFPGDPQVKYFLVNVY